MTAHNNESETRYKELLDVVIGVDPYIRSATIVNLDGTILGKQMVTGAKDFLTEEQNRQIMEYTLNYWNYRKTMTDQIGNAKFILESYENFKKLTMTLGPERLLIVTFEKEGGQRDIVERIQSAMD